MKKICFFSGDISRSGGTERVGTIIANGLSKKGYEVIILSMWNSGNPYFFVEDSIRVDSLLDPKTEGKKYRTVVYPIIKLHNYIKKNNIDIFIDIDTVLSYYTARAIRGTSCKLISWEQFNYWAMERFNEHKRYYAKRLIKKRASALVVLTDEDRIAHSKKYDLKEGFVRTINNPAMYDNEVEYNFDNKTFVSAGRLTYQKGYERLLEAWSMICREIEDWKLVIVGDGELKSSLFEKKDKLELKNIEFKGQVTDVEKYYKEASAYVLSSVYEGFPMVILEAQSNGLPVIAFDCKTGPRDLVENEKNGYLIEDGNIALFANKMLEFSKNKIKAEVMSENAKNNVKKYSLETIISQWVSLIETI